MVDSFWITANVLQRGCTCSVFGDLYYLVNKLEKATWRSSQNEYSYLISNYVKMCSDTLCELVL